MRFWLTSKQVVNQSIKSKSQTRITILLLGQPQEKHQHQESHIYSLISTTRTRYHFHHRLRIFLHPALTPLHKSLYILNPLLLIKRYSQFIFRVVVHIQDTQNRVEDGNCVVLGGEDTWIYFLIDVSFQLWILYFGEAVEEQVVLLWVCIGGFAYLLASTGAVEKLLLIHLQRYLRLDSLAFYSTESTPLDNSSVEILSDWLNVGESRHDWKL